MTEQRRPLSIEDQVEVGPPDALPTALEDGPPGPGGVSTAPAATPSSPVESPSAAGARPAAPTVVADSTTAEVDPGGVLEELVLPSLVSAPEPLAPGTELGPDGRLRVVEHLGTRGRVNRYAATWRQDDGEEIEVELREGPADHAGLQRESEILTSVRYAMLPRAHLACEEGSRRYLAVDHLDGETLDRAFAAGLPVDRALSLVLQLVQVVRRLHQAGWALLGLTPADVVLGQPLRIAQLGQAGRIGEIPAQALHVAGYSAPELASRQAITGKEDVYTLGALLYHALTGRPPSDGGVEEADVLDAIRLPGAPQLLADVLTPADERIDVDALYGGLLALKSRHAETALSLDVASATTVGLNPTRMVNEDSCCYAVWSRAGADGARETALLCVADGMGGMEAGEVASQTAVSVVMRGAARTLWPATPGPEEDESTNAPAEPTEGPYPVMRGVQGWPQVAESPAGLDSPALDPVALVREAARAVHAAAQGRNLGTTITCAAVHDGELTLAHVGDTRAYLLRGGDLTRLTSDHSLVAAMVASGVITAEEAKGHPDSNKVLRSLGSQRELPPGYVDTLQAAIGAASLLLEVGDWLVLCSDGVWGTVEDREIQIALGEALDAQNAARALVDRAIQGGAPDNATAVVARCVQRPVH